MVSHDLMEGPVFLLLLQADHEPVRLQNNYRVLLAAITFLPSAASLVWSNSTLEQIQPLHFLSDIPLSSYAAASEMDQ